LQVWGGASRRLKAYLAAVAASSCVLTAEVFLLMIGFAFYGQIYSAPGMYGDPATVFEATPLVLVTTFFATATLMFVPWILVMCITHKMRWSGPSFFIASGSATAVVVGCFASFCMPKLLFIEDQTFLEAFMIFVKRLAPMLFVSGLVGGWTYWFVAERHSRT
jgi:hypothetical protein